MAPVYRAARKVQSHLITQNNLNNKGQNLSVLTAEPKVENAATVDEYHIVSFVLQAVPAEIPAIYKKMDEFEAVEIHGQSAQGKIVITIEGQSQRAISTIADQVKCIAGILTLAPVYHQYIDETEHD